nr:RHS repeat protein [Rhizobacter sp. SG703]
MNFRPWRDWCVACFIALASVESASAQGACTAAQVSDFNAQCAAQGVAVQNLVTDCLRWDPSGFTCGSYPLPSRVRAIPEGLACQIKWIRSPSGQEGPIPTRTWDALSLGCGCPANEVWYAARSACVPASPPDGPPPAPTCPRVGDPINPITGSERFEQDLGLRFAGQSLSIVYDTLRRLPVEDPDTGLFDTESGNFGPLWISSLQKKLVVTAGNRGARALRGSGHSIVFGGDGSGTFTTDASTIERLVSIAGGYRLIDPAARSQETYDSQGQLLRIDRADGSAAVYTYSTASTPASVAPGVGYLLSVADRFGRTVSFQYDSVGRTSNITDAAGQQIVPIYDTAGLLREIHWPDTKVRKLNYENTTFPWALTSVVDENGAVWGTIAYDDKGRAISTSLAGGVDYYSVTYTQAPVMQVSETYDSATNLLHRTRRLSASVDPVTTTPNGNAVAYGVGMVADRPRMTSQSQPAGAGCAASTSNESFDANGNVSQHDDFNGVRSCRAYDLGRNLETARVDGLAQTASCAALVPPGAGASATVPAGARKTSTQWHPDWRVSAKLAEPGRITTSVYNGQPDPFNGNAIASCAPTTALLPGGKPIAVLCKKVEQSTTDVDGHLGFSAPLQSGVASRVSMWTYNAYGQVLTAKGPRTSVNDTTTYAYYTDTTADHTVGDLMTVTNAAGKVTTYNKYNKLGQLLQSTDPNGNVTINTYDARQHLLTSSVAGETTTYAYDPVGQLVQVTQADGSWVGYEYDDAHRQKAVKDNLGNRIEYQLDNAGSKTGESIKDPTGSLKRSLARVMDALGRIQQNTGKE